jgi:hypothetical protein
MKKHLLFLLLAMSMPLFAQTNYQTTTYTTTTDACGGKAQQFCTLPVTGGTINQIIIDNRQNYGNLYLGAFTLTDQVQGVYSGFVANPDGSHSPFNGIASFESNDGTVVGSFTFSAYYVSTCSGRGCGGTLGWHYKILSGSTVTVTR